MIRIPGIPFLPGTTFRDTSRTDFRRSQKFMTLNGIQMLSDRLPSPNDPNCSTSELPSLYPPNEGPKLPSWLVYDKKVLCFYGFFREPLPEVYLAPFLIRKVKILFYLEDGTMQVSEPKVENSGIPQGCLVSRQRIPKPSPHHHEFISILDLNVNRTVRIFDRDYQITGCDLFTRNFLNRAGIPVPDPVDTPADPSEELRKKSRMRPKQSTISSKESSFEKFLKYDKQVLKFFGYWQDNSEFGEPHNLEVYYYLADDSIEIKEIFPQNSGRDAPGVFLKRGKLPKEWNGIPLPGELTQQPILNVLGRGFGSARYLKDSQDIGKRVNHYKDSDLMIGKTLNVFGRNVVLTDCDPFTKDFYKEKYGIEEFTPLPNPAIEFSKRTVPFHEHELPPWNGWGSHEDSEQNCKTVEPKPPQIDVRKFIQLDRFILRFGAKMLSNVKENCQRTFVISYYLSDDTIQVYELPERNSGFKRGEFFKRSKFLLPNQNLFSSKRPEYYKPHHLYIGATVNIRNHLFHVVSADEYTLLYMENHPYEFPYSNIEGIISKVRSALAPNYKNFIAKYIGDVSLIDGHNTITHDKIRTLLIDLLGKNITDHEIITICRYFSALKQPPAETTKDKEKIRSAVHWEIKRHLWDETQRLKEYIYHLDAKESGFLTEKKVRTIILGCRLPLNHELIDAMLTVLNRNASGEVEICDFLDFVDTSKKPAKPIPPINVAFELCPKMPFLQSGLIVDWDMFLKKIDLEKDLKRETE